MVSIRLSTEGSAPLLPHSYSHRPPFATTVDEHELPEHDESLTHSKLPLDLHGPLTPPLSDDEHDRRSMSSSDADSCSGSCSPSEDNDSTRRISLEQVSERQREELPAPLTFERKLGETEVSYFLPSRADGVNDMYLHLGLRAPAHLFEPRRVRAAWAYFRLKHTALASKVSMEAWDYDSARFVYTAPRSVNEALANADNALIFREASKDVLIDNYLNGERTLSNERLSCLFVGCTRDLPTPALTPELEKSENETRESEDEECQFDILMCTTHFLGDGMALHTFANELFTLLGGASSEGAVRSTEEIETLLEAEWEKRWGTKEASSSSAVLPPSVEEALPPVNSRLRRTAAKIDHQNSQKKLIGGHAFPKRKSAARKTVVPTIPFSPEKTKQILKKCKANGVSIASALFALSALAWSRTRARKEDSEAAELPVMMYSALNVRPYLRPEFTAKDAANSYWFTAIGYLNVILPTFLPKDASEESVEKVFWHRAQEAKTQITKAAKHPLLVSRTHAMAEERGARARVWAREDDEKEAGIFKAPVSLPPTPPSSAPSSITAFNLKEEQKKPWVLPKAPSTALIGLSMLGNLDAMYSHASYPSINLHTLTTGSRQRNGASLLFGYTFKGKLWVSLGYDELGYEEGVDGIGEWWRVFLEGVDEFLV